MYSDSGERRTFSQSAASNRTHPSSIGKSLSCSRDLPRNPSVKLESGLATASAPASGEDLRPLLPSRGRQIFELSFPSPSRQVTRLLERLPLKPRLCLLNQTCKKRCNVAGERHWFFCGSEMPTALH